MAQENSLVERAHHRPARVHQSFGLIKANVTVVLLAFVIELASFFPATAGSLSGVVAMAAFAYVAGGFVPLLWRHRAPMTVFSGLLLHQAIFVFFTTPNYLDFSEIYRIPYMPITTVLVALAAVASDRSLRQSLAAYITAIALPVLISARGRPFDEDLWFIGTGAVWLGGAWALGRFVARNRLRISALEEERRKVEAAVAQERAHIAAELHDIVSHAVTVMMLHAAGGRRVIDTDPERAAQALEVIESVGTEATQELARLLRLLKPAGETADKEQQTPLPTLNDIHGLIEPVRSAGVQVDVKASGEAGKLDPSVAHAAYRVVQESLTNISKHAGSGTNALINLRWEPRNLTLHISDDGAGTPENPHNGTSGYGLLGLKERVEVAGGSIEWGPKDRGFVLTARLPSSP
ncbi:sensor histidine kinase [Arthrobacter sp. ISL-28]|uniref:sensor histidine kinase n=1 Tax=Arthrobacter sp. ISL-28 TaxID=2819108 RepID=UPI001BEA8CDF|nr:sensor histidine kinase [Arthrobacter sp. ISL-28]MBT2523836.1 sensor histidine kinase [Arthrobacter sp. ISL-28]